MQDKDYCKWCSDEWENKFTIKETWFNVPVNNKLINYCPFCGRKLKEEYECRTSVVSVRG